VFLEYFVACSWINARRKLRSDSYTHEEIIDYENEKFTLLDSREATYEHILKMSSFDGAGMRILRHLDLIGEISLCIFEHMSIILQFFIYISIVLLNAPCAYLDNLSASCIIKTLNVLLFFDTSIL
jgi:hypothetical protein